MIDNCGNWYHLGSTQVALSNAMSHFGSDGSKWFDWLFSIFWKKHSPMIEIKQMHWCGEQKPVQLILKLNKIELELGEK